VPVRQASGPAAVRRPDPAQSFKLPGTNGCDATQTPKGNQPPSPHAERVRLEYLARRLHALGERPLFEFLNELERGAELRASLERYATLPADFIRGYGGDRFAMPFIVTEGRAR